jgi:IS1 family transposase
MWSFVAKKANKQWVWIAMDKQTRQIIAFHVGDRSHESAKQLWTNLPAVYREQATFYTDQYAVYQGISPAAQHKAITKHARKTNHIERFNEDACRIRKDKGAQTFSVLRHIAVNLLRHERRHKRGIKARRKRAGWDQDYLLQVLAG